MVNKRIKSLVRRALNAKTAGGKHFDRARNLVALARNAGLQVGEAVELEVPTRDGSASELRKFILVDNFAAEKASRTVTVPRFEVVKLAKNPRAVASAVSADGFANTAEAAS